MAGKITVSTINDDTGVLATQNGMTGIAKAWVQFAGTTGTIAGSFNVSSVTRNGNGDYTINFTTVMPNANYAFLSTGSNIDQANGSRIMFAKNGTIATGSIRMLCVYSGTTVTDSDVASVAIFSS